MDRSTDDFVARLRLDADPMAESAAQVRTRQARFTVLTSRLVRLEWSSDATFEDRGSYAFPHRQADVPPFEVRDDGTTVVLDTGALVLRHTPDGRPFDAANTSIELTGTPGTTWRPGLVDRRNLGGARRTVDGCAGAARLERGLVSRSGWALHDDSTTPLFDGTGWIAARRSGPDARDWYFFGYGHDFPAAIEDYTHFGGKVPLVPRWLLGVWWSRYWAYTSDELLALADEFVARGFPLDVLVVDMDWHLPDSWTGYTWNRELVPDPPALLRAVHERGLRTTLNLHPALGVQTFESAYPQFARAMGIDPKGGRPIAFAPTDREFVRHYFELLHHPIEDEGVDFWWLDWQQGRSGEHDGIDPLPWLNHLHFQDMLRHTDRRPLDFSRWGGLGSHRYPIGFSGDSYATWDALAFQPRYTAAGANVGYGWWSHDIGGHVGPDTPELFVRWLQFGALSPVLRLHSTKDADAERRPWAFGDEVTEFAHAAFALRYELIPYLYTAARTAHDSGVAPVRPMTWVAPDDDNAYAARYQYLLGPDLVAAPVVHPADPLTGTAEVAAWLPAGDWIERSSGLRVTGPRWVGIEASLGDVPQFVRAGAVLPLAVPTNGGSETQPDDHLVLSVFPGASHTSWLYEDDGTTTAYADGDSTWTEFRTSSDDRRCAVTICATTSSHRRRWTLRFEHVNRPDRVLLDGAVHTDWTHDRTRLVVQVPARSRADETVVVVDAPVTPGPERAPMRPLVRIDEYTTPDEAVRTVGAVVVAGDDATATVEWRFSDSDGERLRRTGPVAITRRSSTIEAPYAWDGTLRPVRWSADVTVTSPHGDVHRSHAARVLVPCFASWRARTYVPGAQVPSVDDALASDLAGWERWADDPDDDDYAELSQPTETAAPDHRSLDRTGAIVDLVTTVLVGAEQDVAFEYRSPDAVEFRLDGAPLTADVTGAPPSARYDNRRSARRTASTRLAAGEHTLFVRCTTPADLPWPIWGMSLGAVDPSSGEVLLDVSAR